MKTAKSPSFETLESRRLFSITPAGAVAAAAVTPVISATPSTSLGGTGITGQYFAGSSATPVTVRTDNVINFNYANGRPDADIPKGGFTAKWTGQIAAPTTDTYTFYTNANSHTRVTIDGVVVINTFASTLFDGSRPSVTSGTFAMTAGQKYSIEVDYTSQTKGPAIVQLLWSATGIKQQIVPKTSLFTDPTVALPTGALTGYYYGNAGFSDLLMTRADPAIRFDFGTGSPGTAIPHNKRFFIRWIGNIVAPVTGKYTFQSITDDGVRLFVNGIEIIKDFNVHSAQADLGQITLQAGQNYAVRMDYFNDGGAGHASAKLLWKLPGQKKVYRFVPFTLAKPAAPINVATSGATATGLTVIWNDVANETGFIILRSSANLSSSSGTIFTQVGTTGQGITTFNDSGLTPGTTYSYEIVAVNAAGDSPPSAPATGTTLTPTTVPTAVVASATTTGSTATISWTASPTATSYLVERSLNASSGFTSIGTTSNTTLPDTGLAGGTTYYYRVTPVNNVGSGPVSNVVSILTVPSVPPNLTAHVATASEIDLSWTDVTGETGFIVEESLSATSGFKQIGTTAAGVTSFPDSGLNPATHYFFRVIAVDATGDSDPSNIANATTSASNPPDSAIDTVYGLTATGLVYSIDTTTGAATQVGTLSFGTVAAGRDPANSLIYYANIGSSTVNISAWSPFDGSNTVIRTGLPLSGAISQATFASDGTFYVTTNTGDLYGFNSNNQYVDEGNIRFNGNPLTLANGDIAISPDGSKMYIESNSELYSISSTPGDGFFSQLTPGIITATDIGPTGGPNLQLAFGQGGLLFGTDATGQLYTVNPATAATTPIGTASGINFGDLASEPLQSDLTVTQTASAFTRGGTGTYTFTANNAGPDTSIYTTTLVDTLPAGVAFISGTGTDWTFHVSGQTVTMTYPINLPAGTNAPPATINVAIATGVASSVTNSVTVSTNVFDANTSNNTSTLTTQVSG